jgi:hypothetical protein
MFYIEVPDLYEFYKFFHVRCTSILYDEQFLR